MADVKIKVTLDLAQAEAQLRSIESRMGRLSSSGLPVGVGGSLPVSAQAALIADKGKATRQDSKLGSSVTTSEGAVPLAIAGGFAGISPVQTKNSGIRIESKVHQTLADLTFPERTRETFGPRTDAAMAELTANRQKKINAFFPGPYPNDQLPRNPLEVRAGVGLDIIKDGIRKGNREKWLGRASRVSNFSKFTPGLSSAAGFLGAGTAASAPRNFFVGMSEERKKIAAEIAAGQNVDPSDIIPRLFDAGLTHSSVQFVNGLKTGAGFGLEVAGAIFTGGTALLEVLGVINEGRTFEVTGIITDYIAEVTGVKKDRDKAFKLDSNAWFRASQKIESQADLLTQKIAYQTTVNALEVGFTYGKGGVIENRIESEIKFRIRTRQLDEFSRSNPQPKLKDYGGKKD